MASTSGITGEKIWLDGRMVNWDDANVHILTHTLHYGLGVFEGIRCYRTDDGRSAVFRLSEHIRRLFESAHINLLRIPYTQEEIIEAVLDCLRANRLEEGYIRPLVFVGEGAMGLNPADNPIRDRLALGQVPGRGGNGAGHPRQGLHLHPSLREREDDQGEDLWRLRELDSRQAGVSPRRL
jgi:branched-subunit amino acid aminotransferase/4-amino-4-deoxychorismate lyase